MMAAYLAGAGLADAPLLIIKGIGGSALMGGIVLFCGMFMHMIPDPVLAKSPMLTSLAHLYVERAWSGNNSVAATFMALAITGTVGKSWLFTLTLKAILVIDVLICIAAIIVFIWTYVAMRSHFVALDARNDLQREAQADALRRLLIICAAGTTIGVGCGASMTCIALVDWVFDRGEIFFSLVLTR